ncbi:unnamed protein product [Blepharisma stoltei]|uniref:Uncharacterized protein n=1 Tax=Blepharisma stoltei TaxID=1481888 RepID=A0AAU9KER5_9CILI|nr:unnamed protein product [Blepharisma stoltei]
MSKKICTDLILKLNLTSTEQETLGREEQIEKVMQSYILHLEWQNIIEIDNLELYSHIKYLHLQYNLIEKIQNLEFMINLEFLTLEGNKITYIQGLKTLKNLLYLNLANNQIILLSTEEIPNDISILKLNGNPCASESEYRETLIKALPYLDELDGSAVRPEERLRILGLEVPKYAPIENEQFDETEEEFRISSENLDTIEKPDHGEIEKFMTEDEDLQLSKITEKAWEIVQRSKERVNKLLDDKVRVLTAISEENEKMSKENEKISE